MAKIAVLG